MPDLSATLRQPFAEQVAAFRLRLGTFRDTSRWDDLRGAEHDRAFMVAGAVGADLLGDLAAAVGRGIAEGATLEDFRRDFRAIVERRGWHGWTGEGSAKGEAWRTRVIWETNMRTSYAAGRMAQLVEGDFAFWIYRHGGSREPRPQHLAWDGLTLPPDHPFWTTHAPPNGWGCSCSVTGSRSRRIARRMGGDPDMTLPEGWDRPDPRTGAPPGIDRGWAHAPGASVAETVRTMAEKAVNWDYSLSVAYMRDLPPAHVDAFARAYRALPSLATELRRWSERVIGVRNGGPIDPKVTVVPQKSLGLATVAQVAQIERLTGLTVKGQLLDLAIDRDAVRHVMARHTDPETERSRGQRPVLPTDFGKLGELVNGPDRMVLGPRIPRRGPVVRYEKIFGAERYVALFEVRTGRRRLSLVTMRVEKGAGASPTATP